RGTAAAVARATARAEAARQRLEEDRERAHRLHRERAAAQEQGRTGQALARHLQARGFEQWLVDEALDVLVTDGSARLRELSSGQYSLARDARANLQVVDHRNADERRPAKTLSGGETFLASLALALALAERLAELAVHRAARLEAIFLDEGFGTLDAATLDTVAAAVEELGTGGRTVGLVTHVRELAERVPVRYEVRKGPRTSTVERVDQ
ncbi:MAG: SMC family ATPase, partial [Actinomycetota bacterium]|nr:SMC family ATPase [Actinomycetota bacterium]